MSAESATKFETLVAQLSGLSSEAAVDGLRTMFAYQGYDPSFILKEMYNRGAANARAAGTVFNEKVFHTDLQEIAIISMLTGTGWFNPKFAPKHSKEANEKIAFLRARYNLVKSTPGQPLERTDIVVSRVVNAVPWVAASLYARGYGTVVGTIPDGLPRFYCFPGGASLIPRDETGLFNLYLTWSKSFDSVINQNNQTSPQRLTQIATAAWQSAWIPDGQRKTYRDTFTKIQTERNVPNKN